MLFRSPSRQSCTAPIPTCNSVCGKIQTLCGHECSAKCHLKSCLSCSVPLTRPCRCGVTTREIKQFITGDDEKELSYDHVQSSAHVASTNIGGFAARLLRLRLEKGKNLERQAQTRIRLGLEKRKGDCTSAICFAGRC